MCNPDTECVGGHIDGIDLTGNSGWTIRHNTILNEGGQTSAIFAGAAKGNDGSGGTEGNVPHDVTVVNNYLAGGGYTIYGGDEGIAPSHDYTFTDNLLSTRYFPRGGYGGPRAHWDEAPSNVWARNVWADGPNEGEPVLP